MSGYPRGCYTELVFLIGWLDAAELFLGPGYILSCYDVTPWSTRCDLDQQLASRLSLFIDQAQPMPYIIAKIHL